MSHPDHDRGGQWCAAHIWLASRAPIEQVPVVLLRRGDSPRLNGASKHDAVGLLDTADTPPIIVHRPTMQVIDGLRRWTAAQFRHQDTIAVRYFEGTAVEAFVLGVVANITTHGLPLTSKDRKAAAARILGMYPDWSDRMIASTAGLSHHTVSVIRRDLSSTGQIAQFGKRLGKDGKTRPAAPSDRGRVAPQPGPADHSAAAHESARHTDGSAEVVQGVRARSGQRVEPFSATTCPGRGGGDFRAARGYVALKRLWANPALHTDKGRALMHLLWSSLQVVGKAPLLTADAPEHCLDTVADAVSAIGDSWAHLAEDLHNASQRRLSATPLTDNGSASRVRHE